ncbi:hypothetical protein [Novosphingobium sp. SG720]|uniref:hypothetical protein n=1 Tax=Novosphingobium sp. SG720 TaxID=2586998 RepID=UPI0014484BC2|nr:hypothetical protein [Novosphingobium sp. SG720]NKJ43180.1 hypothetical protein [Novosphingobium sp. SG720]
MTSLITKVLALIRQRPGASLVALALLACAVALGWLLVDRANLRADLATAQTELAKVKDAQPAARAAQAAVNHQPAAVSATIAEISDAQASAYYERGRAAGAAYAAAHRVPASCPASQPGHADLPGADHPAPLDDGAGSAADDVALSRADFEILTGNSLRLAQVYQDAQALIAAGIAVAPPDAPAP